MKVWDLDQQADPEALRDVWEGMATGDCHRVEGEYRRRDGSTFPVEVHIRRLGLEGNDRFAVISRDISDRKARERELRRYERIVNTMLSQALLFVQFGLFSELTMAWSAFVNTRPPPRA